MDEKPDSGTAWLLNWQMAALVAIIGLVLAGNLPPLKSGRPQVTPAKPLLATGDQHVPARLWQDPFRAVEEFMQREKSFQLPHSATISNQIQSRLNEILVSANSNKFIGVLPVVVSGGAYADDAESRLRSRYAVVSALGVSGFTPADAKNIGCFGLPWPSDSELLADINAAPKSLGDMSVPYEWFIQDDLHPPRDGTESNHAILVLWLNDDAFVKLPLKRFVRLFQALRPADPNLPRRIRFTILGPRTSAGLQTMLREVRSGNFSNYCSNFDDVTMVSSWATAAPEYLLGNTNETTQGVFNDRHGPKFLSVTCGDDALARVLVNELAARGVKCDRPDAVALIAEWDTFYGRAFPKAFSSAVASHHGYSTNIAHYRYRYLLGLDEQPVQQGWGPSAKSDDKPSLRVAAKPYVEHPMGANQLDYIRRLSRQMEEDFKAGRLKAIGVVGSDVYDKLLLLQDLQKRFPGVLFFTTDQDGLLLHGTAYEWTHNLLIASSHDLSTHNRFQSGIPPFRDSYQTALFLAGLSALNNTNLDARTLTNLYRPKMFEVGRSGAVSLLPPPKDRLKTTPTDWRPILLKWEVALVFILSLCCMVLPFSKSLRCFVAELLTSLPSRPFRNKLRCLNLVPTPPIPPSCAWWEHLVSRKSRALIVTFFVCVCVVLLGELFMAFSLFEDYPEPYDYFEGVSVWPTATICLLAAFCAIMFLVKTWFDLYAEMLHLTEKYRIPPTSRMPVLCRSLWRIIQYRCAISISAWSLSEESADAEGDQEKSVSSTTLIEQYIQRAHPVHRFVRCVPTALNFLLLALIVFLWLGFPNTPYRGIWACVATWVSLTLAVLAFLLLLFFVLDAARLCRKLIQLLGQGRTNWGFLKQTTAARRLMRAEDVDGWLDVKMIASQTGVLGKMIYYPFIVLVLLMVSRMPCFDNWNMPISLVIVVGACAVYALVNALLIRGAAEKVRRDAIACLQEKSVYYASASGLTVSVLSDAFGNPSVIHLKGEEYARKLTLTIQEIQRETDGAFAPLMKDPVIGALLLPSGWVGIQQLIQRIITM